MNRRQKLSPSDKITDLQPPKKTRVQPYAGKTLLTVFRNQHGEENVDILAKGTTITGTYYASLLKKLRKSIKRCVACSSSQLACCSDRSPVLRLGILPHPPYSPDLAPSDFHLFNHEIIFKGKAILKRREAHFRRQSVASRTTVEI